MKVKLIPSFIMILSLMVNGIGTAQNSEGGSPYSFFNHLRGDVLQNIPTEILPPFDLASLQAEDAINDQNTGPFRFGFNHLVNYNLENSGNWNSLANGDRLWMLHLKSVGATSLNLAFDDFFMPAGAKLFIYDANKKQVIGAFTNLNNQDDHAFATDLIQGEEVVLEYFEPRAVKNQGRIQLFRVTHGYRGMKDYLGKSFGASGACQQNVNCPLGSNWQKEKNAVVFLITSGNVVCTGALINDVPQDSKPYILTANHCSSSGYSTWVFRFNWEAPDCTNPPSNPSSLSLTGCVKRAAYEGSDMSLVEITGGLIGQTIPANYNPYFAGWSAVNTPATSAVCIHHPNGDIKKISEAANPTISTLFTSPPKFNNTSCWRVGQWTTGTTEPGSSGSPLFDQNKRIVGQLAGGPSSCGESPLNLNDYFGKFATSWLGGGTSETQLKYWLDPDNTGTTTMDGTDSLILSVSNERVEKVLSVKVFPNPNKGDFNLEIKLSKPQMLVIRLINLLGETIYTDSYPATENEIYSIHPNFQTFGIYFLEVETEKEKQIQKISIMP